MDVRSFGRLVRARRVEEGWSQEHLARKASVSRNYLSQIERGVAQNVSWQVVEHLVTALGLSPSEVLEEPRDWSSLPPGLREFARAADLPPGDVEMLARIQYRGNQPATELQWQLLYDVIKIATRGT